VAGEIDAISPAAQRGLKLFVGRAACVDCHSGPAFTDNQFHNISVPQIGTNTPSQDLGRFADIGIYKNHPFNSASTFNDSPDINRVTSVEAVELDKGKFRTQSLRNIAETSPYMHTGNFVSLREVIEFYNGGGSYQYYSGEKSLRQRNLQLTDEEISDLVAFLETLTGEPIREYLTKNPQ
jgi:cytochrome c peroxidase